MSFFIIAVLLGADGGGVDHFLLISGFLEARRTLQKYPRSLNQNRLRLLVIGIGMAECR